MGAGRVRPRRGSGVDEIAIALSPVMFGGGVRLFDGIDPGVELELVQAVPSPRTTHVRYAVRRR